MQIAMENVMIVANVRIQESKNDGAGREKQQMNDRYTIELTKQMEKDKKNCCEDLCTSDSCTLWMENADCCLIELIKNA